MTEKHLALAACEEFRGTKRVLLRDVGREKKTQRQVVRMLRVRYDKLLANYLRIKDTTYEAWIEHGPKAELDELIEAARDPDVWDRLVETYDKRPRA